MKRSLSMSNRLVAPNSDVLAQADARATAFTGASTSTCCIHALFEQQVDRAPDAVAVEFQGERLTYAQLDERSTRLANYLRARNVRVESLVGVRLERSLDLLVTLLGIMKAGGAYVPLDPSFPAERLVYMLKDSGATILVTRHAEEQNFADFHGLTVDLGRDTDQVAAQSKVRQPSGVQPDNLAYVIYTSGSTGNPKGVMIPHGAVVNFLVSMRGEPGINSNDALLATTNYSFDIAVLELFLPLIVGAKVIVADQDTLKDPKKMAEELFLRKATLMQATPAMWRVLINGGWTGNEHLKVLCGGEAMPRDLAEELLKRAGSVWNMYGPTETTVWSLVARVHSESGAVPIGRPIANTTAHILDPDGRPAPRGEIGRLHLGGQGLARGYRNRPELTSQRFVFGLPVNGGSERLYDTGDLALERGDGLLEWHGRLDHQVKLRGYRIELGEIECVLRRHPAVRDAVVTIRVNAPDDQRLIAYFVSDRPATPSLSEIRKHAETLLPDYMVPSTFLSVDALPLTPNGKLDRAALPDPYAAGSRPVPPGRIRPQSALEQTLLRLFEELLLSGPLGVTDNFLELGGNSLLAAQLVIRIKKETGQSIPTATLFAAPTVRQLACKLRDRTYGGASSHLVELRKGNNPPGEPLFCVHWLDAKLITFHKIASLLKGDRTVYGLQPGDLGADGNTPRTIKEMAALYVREIRACRPRGPYHLAGSCLGGVVAFEIAQQLTAAGERVELLLLIDAYMPGPLQYLHTRAHAVEFLDSYLGEFLLSPTSAVKRWLRESVTRVFHRTRETGDLSRSSGYLKKLSREASANYLPMPYRGSVTLLICSDGPSRAYEDRRLAWSLVARGGFEVEVVPGNHSTMEREPNIQVLAATLQRCFDRLAGKSLEVSD